MGDSAIDFAAYGVACDDCSRNGTFVIHASGPCPKWCSSPGCDLPARASGMCNPHYQRAYKKRRKPKPAGKLTPKGYA